MNDTTPDLGELAADNSDDNATLTRAAIGGEASVKERRELRAVGHRLIDRGMSLVAAAA